MVTKSAPTVSIVMPTYNRAGLLPRSVASILSQDFDDFELLVVDDGSTDNTTAVVKEIQAQDPRVRYLKLLGNRGIGFTRDAGLQHVSGKYIGFADSDDLWLPGKLKVQVEVLEEYPEIEILFGDFRNINHLEGTEFMAFARTQVGMKQLVVHHVVDDLYIVEEGLEVGILRKTFIQLGTVLLKADVLERIGGFDATLSGSEDLEFCWRAAVLGAQYAYIDRLLVERHIIESSVTARAVDSWTARLKALKVMRRECESAQWPDLLSHIRAAEHRTWRHLIWVYGRQGQRVKAIRAYGRSLHYGFSTGTLFFFATALLGPQAISFTKNLLRLRANLKAIREAKCDKQ